MKLLTSKFFTSQANLVLNEVESKRVIGAAPLFPAFRFSQNSGIVLPRGVSAPIPVTTTRFKVMFNGMGCKKGSYQLFLNVLFQVRNSLANSRDVFSLVVRNRD